MAEKRQQLMLDQATQALDCVGGAKTTGIVYCQSKNRNIPSILTNRSLDGK